LYHRYIVDGAVILSVSISLREEARVAKSFESNILLIYTP
jgi:hypothetical protein